MYAVIQTGGKQYRVRAGDVIVVEKLDGDVGAEIQFDNVLMAGGGDNGVSLGDKLKGAAVTATLIETRKGEKIKVFKKIRRQGYRRTQGHRQFESVLRITGLNVGGETAKWDGTVDLTPRSTLVARARGLAPMVTTSEVMGQPAVETAAPKPAKAKAPKAEAAAETPAVETPAVEAAEAPAPKKAKAPKASVEQPISETPATGAQTDVDANAATETGSMAASEEAAAKPKKAAAPKKPKAPPQGDAE